MAEADNRKNKNTSKIIFFSIIGLLIVVLGVSVYFNLEQDKQNEFVQAELDNTYQELSLINDELNQKIEEIEKLGGDVSELKQVREEMEQEMSQLQESSDIAWARYNKIKNKVEGYEELLIMKDKEIAHLQTLNQALVTENTDLKTEKNQLEDSISLIAKASNKLAEKVEVASRLTAENLAVYAVNDRGREREGEFRARQADQLKVEFNIGKNDVAPIEGKDIMIRIVEPEGNVVFDVAKGSGTFMINGKEEFYTQKQEILFDNTSQLLTFFYEKGSEFVPGQHQVEVYTDGYMMGSKPFIVK